MKDALYNQRFEDIYFSPEDGLAETRHVFLAGNNLPDAWRGRQDFIICETGFGTGLNFLATAIAFEDTADQDAVLHYISFEKYPLERNVIAQALRHWQQELGGALTRLLDCYPLRIDGFHRLWFSPRICLTLIFDDVNDALPQLDIPRLGENGDGDRNAGGVDAWFLDGFAPSKNPDMWGDVLFDAMACLSAPDATIATFTAAGFVKRAIENAGFTVHKKPGFGRKREMITARKHGGDDSSDDNVASSVRSVNTMSSANPVRSVAIVGGGLAGCAAAYALRHYDIKATIFEAGDHLAFGASGNIAGLYNPRFTAIRNAEADYFNDGFALAYRVLSALSAEYDIGFAPMGVLYCVDHADQAKRFSTLCEKGGWHHDHMRMVDAAEASRIAGVEIRHKALYLPQSGMVNPAKLCAAYADETEIIYGVRAVPVFEEGRWNVEGRHYDAVILACGAAAKHLCGLDWLPVYPVRGQVTQLDIGGDGDREARIQPSLPQVALCYDGYAVPLGAGHMVCGATFQKFQEDRAVIAADDTDNVEKLLEMLPHLRGYVRVSGQRAGIRTASQDHWPLIGKVPDYAAWQAGGADKYIQNLYISTGHGSYGIVSSIMAAHMIADIIAQVPLCVGADTVRGLEPARFLARLRKKNML